ncbi:MAG: NADP-dependent malic enzyme [Acutalibacteraceae bacterium]
MEEKNALKLHENLHGKIEVVSRCDIKTKEDLSLIYTPGVAKACEKIKENYSESFNLTRRSNLVAVITDGSAVLGLGNIGPAAAMPVMEGKCALFKEFGGVDAFPICVDSNDTEEIIKTIFLISKSFGGINLEDISAPRCFEIERRLQEICDIPVFHDDQHGTAIVVAAALINAVKYAKKSMGKLKIVINGAGAAGIAIAKLLLSMEFGDIILCDINGILDLQDSGLNDEQRQMCSVTNKSQKKGKLMDALVGADVLIGVSRGNLVSKEMISKMNSPIVFAMANPVPEIYPEEAYEAGAVICGTGRSDYKNQINNVLAFPGIFKGVLKNNIKIITEEMMKKAAFAISDMVSESEISQGIIVPDVLNKGVADKIAEEIAK